MCILAHLDCTICNEIYIHFCHDQKRITTEQSENIIHKLPTGTLQKNLDTFVTMVGTKNMKEQEV